MEALKAEIEALEAQVARLEVEKEVEKELAASKISGLEQRIKTLEGEIQTREVEKRLSTTTLNDRAPQPVVSPGSSDPNLRAENARLQGMITQRDQNIASLYAINAQQREHIDHLRRSLSGLSVSLKTTDEVLTTFREGFFGSFCEITEDVHSLAQDVVQAVDHVIVFEKHQFREEELTPKESAADGFFGRSGSSLQGNSTKLLLRDTPAERSQPSPSTLTMAGFGQDTSVWSPQLPTKLTPAESTSNPFLSSLRGNSRGSLLRIGPPQTSPLPTTTAESEEETNVRSSPPLSEPTPAHFATTTAAGDIQPSQTASTPAKFEVNTVSAPTEALASNYAQAVKTPARKLPQLRANVPLEKNPLFAKPPVTHADLSATREQAQQIPPDSHRVQISEKPNKASNHTGSVRHRGGRGNEHRGGQAQSKGNRGETLQESTSRIQSTLTSIENTGSFPNQMTVSGSLGNRKEPEGSNAKMDIKQPAKNSDVMSSVASPPVKTEQGVLAEKDTRSNAGPSGSNSKPIARRRRPIKLSNEERAAFIELGDRIPSEDDTEDEAEAGTESVATPVTEIPQSPSKGVETLDVRKRSADECNFGIGAPRKRLRSR